MTLSSIKIMSLNLTLRSLDRARIFVGIFELRRMSVSFRTDLEQQNDSKKSDIQKVL